MPALMISDQEFELLKQSLAGPSVTDPVIAALFEKLVASKDSAQRRVPNEADLIARAIAPDAWAEYDAGKGRCTNMAGWACIESLHAAKRVMAAIGRLGD